MRYSSDLADWRRFILAQGHILKEYPFLIFQQAHNEPNGTAPARRARQRLATGYGERAWIRWINKPESVTSGLVTYIGHHGTVTAITYSPDGMRIASSSQDCTIRLWEANTGRELAIYRGHKQKVNKCAFSPNGRFLVSCSDDKTLKLWDVEGVRLLASLEGHDRSVAACVFSGDGTTIVSASNDRSIKIWSAETGLLVQDKIVLPGDVDTWAWSADGRWLATGSVDKKIPPQILPMLLQTGQMGEEVLLWNVEAGVLAGRIRRGSPARAIAWSPDGKSILVASATGLDRVDVVTGKSIGSFFDSGQNQDSVIDCAWSPDGSSVLAVMDSVRRRPAAAKGSISGKSAFRLVVIDEATQSCRRVISESAVRINRCAWSPDGRSVLAAYEDHTIQAFESEYEAEPNAWESHLGSVASIDYSLDRDEILTGSCHGEQVWNDITVDSFRGELKSWDGSTGRPLRTYKTGRGIALGSWSPDGRRILTESPLFFGSRPHEVLEAESSELLFTLDDRAEYGWRWSPDGRHILACACDDSDEKEHVILRDGETGKLLGRWDAQRGEITFETWPPGSRYAISVSKRESGQRTLRIIDAEAQEEVGTLITDVGSDPVIAWSPDGRFVAISSSGHPLCIWEVRTGRADVLSTPLMDIKVLRWSTDGRYVLTAGADRAIRLWNPETGQPDYVFKASAPLRQAIFIRGGQLIVAGDASGQVLLLELMNQSRPQGIELTVTGVLRYLYDKHDYEAVPTAVCPTCRSRFDVTGRMMDTIRRIWKDHDLGFPDDRQVKLPLEAWRDPGLATVCGSCGQRLRFQPFIVDNRTIHSRMLAKEAAVGLRTAAGKAHLAEMGSILRLAGGAWLIGALAAAGFTRGPWIPRIMRSVEIAWLISVPVLLVKAYKFALPGLERKEVKVAKACFIAAIPLCIALGLIWGPVESLWRRLWPDVMGLWPHPGSSAYLPKGMTLLGGLASALFAVQAGNRLKKARRFKFLMGGLILVLLPASISGVTLSVLVATGIAIIAKIFKSGSHPPLRGGTAERPSGSSS